MAYDANGNLVRVDELFSQSGTLTTTQTFDDFDRLESVTDRWGQVITYGYDANGNRTSLQAPNQSTSYTFDGLNRLETVTTSGGLTRYTYHPNSRLKGIEYPNGTSATYTFDTANRLSTLEHHFGQLTIASYAYTYDDNGNRVSQTETQVGRDTEHTTYTYDLADRLSSVTYPDESIVYTHDRAGNRLTESITPSTGDPYSKTSGSEFGEGGGGKTSRTGDTIRLDEFPRGAVLREGSLPEGGTHLPWLSSGSPCPR